MIALGFDTATRSTAVALRLTDGSTLQARDDPAADERPGHATRLLKMADGLLASAGIDWSALERIAVGRGPGTFTGLRVGIATARGLAQSLGVELVGVSSLQALAESARRTELDGSRNGTHASDRGDRPIGDRPAPPSSRAKGILAVLDARRGEAFAAVYLPTGQRSVEELMSPRALVPEELGSLVAQAEALLADEQDGGWLAIGDGAVRFRGELEAAGVTVPPDASPAHLLSAEAICELGARAPAEALDRTILPEYCRRPDAEIALESKRAVAVAQAAAAGHTWEGRAS